MTTPISPSARAFEYGAFPNRGGYIRTTDGLPIKSSNLVGGTLATAEVESGFKFLTVRGTAGDIVVQGFDENGVPGNIWVEPLCGQGVKRPVAAQKVIFGAVTFPNGSTYSTTATDIWWSGGM